VVQYTVKAPRNEWPSNCQVKISSIRGGGHIEIGRSKAGQSGEHRTMRGCGNWTMGADMGALMPQDRVPIVWQQVGDRGYNFPWRQGRSWSSEIASLPQGYPSEVGVSTVHPFERTMMNDHHA